MINSTKETKEEKIFYVCLKCIDEDNFIKKLRWARILIFQLDDKEFKKLGFKRIDLIKEFEKKLLNNNFNKKINLRTLVTKQSDGYQYFDELKSNASEDVYNYDEKLEQEILQMDLKILILIGVIIRELDLGQDISKFL